MLLAFSWLARAGARAGNAALATNHALLQIVAFWAFVLDAFAFAAESAWVASSGRALGGASIERCASPRS